MKRKSKNANPQITRQFRYHKVELYKNDKKISIWHPAYIFLILGNIFRYVVLTHSNHVEGEEVVPLEKNPNTHDDRVAYRVLGYKEDTKDRFGRKHKWNMSDNDDKKIRENKK